MRAQGEARSAELVGEAVRKNKGFLELRRLEAARDIASQLSQSNNKIMLDSQSLLLNGKCFGINEDRSNLASQLPGMMLKSCLKSIRSKCYYAYV